MRRSLRCLALATVLALSAAGVAVASPAQAAGSPPVTRPDSVRLSGLGSELVDVLRNDRDPDGDPLAICRVRRVPRQLHVEVFNGGEGSGESMLFVAAGDRRAAGTFTFTYYACDYEQLVPATVTVTVEPGPDVKVHRLSRRPGVLKVRNPARFPIVLGYGGIDGDVPDGRIRVAKRSSTVFKVRRHRIFWVAFRPRTGELVDYGEVTGIRLRRGSAADRPGASPPTGKDFYAWRDAVARLR